MTDFTSLKNSANQIAGYYALSDREDFHRYADRMINCAPAFDLRVVPGVDNSSGTLLAHIQKAYWCRVRHCPLCQWARVSKSRAKFFQGLTPLQSDYPRYRWLLLTLTVRNVPVNQLALMCELMAAGWHRLMSRHLAIVGYIRSLEVTRSDIGEAHPHYHALLLVQPRYFSDKYLNFEQWALVWKQSLRVDYLPVVHIKRVTRHRGQTWIKALLEVVKYSVKPSDLVVDSDWLYEVTDQLYRKRAVTVGGLVADYVSQAVLNRIDLSLRSGDEQSQLNISAYLDWDYLEQAYDFSLCDRRSSCSM